MKDKKRIKIEGGNFCQKFPPFVLYEIIFIIVSDDRLFPLIGQSRELP